MSLRHCKTKYNNEFYFYGKDMYIGKSLYYYGEWSGEECDMLLSLSSGGTFVDVGANIGCMSSVLASKANVIAFEPQPVLYELLCKNVPLAESYNCGLFSNEGIAKMPRIRYGDVGNYGGLGFGVSELGSIQVELKTLDSFNLTDVDLIKIDVEGAEADVLVGARDTIARCKPILYVEDDRDEKRANLRKLITSLGYTIEEHNPPMFRANNFNNFPRNVWDKEYISMNLICRPKC